MKGEEGREQASPVLAGEIGCPTSLLFCQRCLTPHRIHQDGIEHSSRHCCWSGEGDVEKGQLKR